MSKKQFYKYMKYDILNCLKHINNIRLSHSYPRIKGRKDDIKNILIIYKFYRKCTRNKTGPKTGHKTEQKTGHNQDKKEEETSTTGRPKLIEKNGYTFVLINNNYHKLTKKAYKKRHGQLVSKSYKCFK